MRLSRKFDYALIALAIVSASLAFLSLSANHLVTTYADNETDVYEERDTYFVTIFDNSKKLTIKTTPKTVAEVLNKLEIFIDQTDIVEPSLDAFVDSDHFFINIYRSHPTIVKDGSIEKYIMTASYDPKHIAKDANITVYDGDEIKMINNDKFLETGIANIYEITRKGGSDITVEEEIPFITQTIKDYTLGVGNSEVRQLGEVGTMTKIYHVLSVDGAEVSRELVSEQITKEPVNKILAVGASEIEKTPLTASKGRNRYTVKNAAGEIIERQETYYDLPMSGVMSLAKNTEGCNHSGHYAVREDGVKIDDDGYILVAADLDRYPRCSVVETSLGLGKVYDTGSFSLSNHEQFDIATDWTNRNGS